MTTPTVPEPIVTLIDRINAHDGEAFLDAFTPDGSVDDWGRTFTGRAAIEAWSDTEFIGSRLVFTVEEATTDGDRVTVVGDWRSNNANGRSSFAFDLDGERIAKLTIREG